MPEKEKKNRKLPLNPPSQCPVAIEYEKTILDQLY
jgi:hypothetical protein